ncbi:hypothetical protein GCM10009710_00510 [Aeromicrobium alkaliterrae]|uniref:Uncharacterized protein n=1 Tax=Aeromicrobium alkaliterrae TaxID=302168 RepID=A0ABP4VHW5_9ACTN
MLVGSWSVIALQIVPRPTPREPSTMLRNVTASRTPSSTTSPTLNPADERCSGRGAVVAEASAAVLMVVTRIHDN